MLEYHYACNARAQGVRFPATYYYLIVGFCVDVVVVVLILDYFFFSVSKRSRVPYIVVDNYAL